MIPTKECVYYGIDRACSKCAFYNPDMDSCGSMLTSTTSNESCSIIASSYEDRLKDYKEQRKKLLSLSKEQLVDLIIQKPSYF